MHWLTPDIQLLLVTAATIGIVHTLLGPDHYVPFIALGRHRGWSARHTLIFTVLCGAGHCLGSVVLGLVGVAVGLSLAGLTDVETVRGDVAAWLLLAFGLVFALWGLRTAARGVRHSHAHVHDDGTLHTHTHDHHDGHLHLHADAPRSRGIHWALFIVFLFGPCEALIPMLMYPAAAENVTGLVMVVAVFVVATVGTMTAAVALGLRAVGRVRWRGMERHSATLTGVAICGCAVAMLAGL